MSETYFVTGGTGFIGKRLVETLVASGDKVVCLVRDKARASALARLGADLIEGDLSALEALRRGVERCDGVFHCAGATRESGRREFRIVNAEGTANVAKVLAERGGVPLVALSSLAAAGIGVKDRSGASESDAALAPYRRRVETDAPRPLSAYGRSKLSSERALAELADRVPTTVLRPPYVFGEGDLLSLALFKMAKNRGTFVSPGYVDYFYSFVYVDDLVEVAIAAMRRGERLERSSLDPNGGSDKIGTCSGKGIYFPTCSRIARFSEFGAAIGRAFGREKIAIVKIPPMGVIGTGIYGEIYKALARKKAPLDWNKATEAIRGPWVCSGEKARRDLGVSPSSEIEAQVERAARWYEKENLL